MPTDYNLRRAGSPTPHGVGGLKSEYQRPVVWTDERPTPHGVGGLKLLERVWQQWKEKSHPSRGGWIEIKISDNMTKTPEVPPLTGWVD